MLCEASSGLDFFWFFFHQRKKEQNNYNEMSFVDEQAFGF